VKRSIFFIAVVGAMVLLGFGVRSVVTKLELLRWQEACARYSFTPSTVVLDVRKNSGFENHASGREPDCLQRYLDTCAAWRAEKNSELWLEIDSGEFATVFLHELVLTSGESVLVRCAIRAPDAYPMFQIWAARPATLWKQNQEYRVDILSNALRLPHLPHSDFKVWGGQKVGSNAFDIPFEINGTAGLFHCVIDEDALLKRNHLVLKIEVIPPGAFFKKAGS